MIHYCFCLLWFLFIKFCKFIKISFCKIKLVIVTRNVLSLNSRLIGYSLSLPCCFITAIASVIWLLISVKLQTPSGKEILVNSLPESLLYLIHWFLYPAFMLNQVSLNSLSRWKTKHLKTKLVMIPDGRDWSYLIRTSYSSIRSRPSLFRFHMRIGNLIRNSIWNSIGNVG